MSLILRHFQRQLYFVRCLSTATSAETSASSAPSFKWDLMAAVCVERKPVITPPLSKNETDVMTMLKQMEFEGSMLNDHELMTKKDLERAERKKQGEIIDTDDDVEKTAFDLEDIWRKDAEDFKPAPRLTDADHNNDIKSVHRMLDKTLRLMVKVKLGDETYWDLPAVVRSDGETMRQTAERAVIERCGDQCDVQVLGNAPWTFFKYKYPKKYREKSVGAKVFVYKAYLTNYLEAEVKRGDSVIDFQWANLSEMENVLNRNMYNAVNSIIFDED